MATSAPTIGGIDVLRALPLPAAPGSIGRVRRPRWLRSGGRSSELQPNGSMRSPVSPRRSVDVCQQLLGRRRHRPGFGTLPTHPSRPSPHPARQLGPQQPTDSPGQIADLTMSRRVDKSAASYKRRSASYAGGEGFAVTVGDAASRPRPHYRHRFPDRGPSRPAAALGVEPEQAVAR